MIAEEKAAAPDWFTHAVTTPSEDRFVHVEGARIHYLRWGQAGKPGLLFVHGGYAHAHWWDFIAPFFSKDHCVAALDLSGMGDSGYRPKYTAETYANEVLSVCRDAGFAQRPVVVGHSFGGFVALKAGAMFGNQLTGIIIADFPFRPPDLQQEHDAKRRRTKPKSVYATFEEALARFRLIPPQPSENQFILDHIAHRSLTKVEAGWTWKFDDYLFDGFELGDITGELAKVSCRMAAIYGEHSALFPPEVIKNTADLLRNRAPFIKIPGAYHHLFLDRPLAFVETMRNVLSEWQNGEHVKPGS